MSDSARGGGGGGERELENPSGKRFGESRKCDENVLDFLDIVCFLMKDIHGKNLQNNYMHRTRDSAEN